MNALYKLRFLFYAWLTNKFYKDHSIAVNEAATIYEDFMGGFHYEWGNPGWDVWNKIIFKKSQLTIVEGFKTAYCKLTTDLNSVEGEPTVKSGQLTSARFFNDMRFFAEVCFKPSDGQFPCALWMFMSKNELLPKGEHYFEVDCGEFQSGNDSFTVTIKDYGLDGKGIGGQDSDIVFTKRFQAKKSLMDNYHVWGIDWQADGLDFYFDRMKIAHSNVKINHPMFVWTNNNYTGGKLPCHSYVKQIRITK